MISGNAGILHIELMKTNSVNELRNLYNREEPKALCGDPANILTDPLYNNNSWIASLCSQLQYSSPYLKLEIPVNFAMMCLSMK